MARALQHRPGILRFGGALAVRSLRTITTVVAVLLVCLILVVVLGIVVSQTLWFHDWLRELVVRQAAQYLNGTLTIGRLSGSIFTNVELDQVVLRHEGKTAVVADKIVLRYDLRTIYHEGVVLDELVLDRPIIYLEHGPEGWNFTRFIKTRKPSGERKSITLQDVQIGNGHVEVRDLPDTAYILNDLNSRFRFSSSPEQIALSIKNLSSYVEPSRITMRELSADAYFNDDAVDVRDVHIVTDRSRVAGRMTLRDYRTKAILNAAIKGDPLSMPELSRVLPWLSTVSFEPRFNAEAIGTLDNLHVEAAIDSSGGRAQGPLIMDLRAPGRTIRGTLNTDQINLARIFNTIEDPTDITGRTEFNLTLPSSQAAPLSVSFQFSGPEVRAFGYRATSVQLTGLYSDRIVRAQGQGNAYGAVARVRSEFRFPPPERGSFSYVTSGSFANLDLTNLPRTLPTPRLASRLAGSFDLEGHRGGWSGDVKLDESVVEGATFSPGTTGRMAVQNSALEYEASGRVTGLDVQRWGTPLDVVELQKSRYQSMLNGEFKASGAGRTLDQLRLDLDANLTGSAALGGQLPQLDLTVHIGDRRLTTSFQGSFEGINPSGFVSQIPADTELTGTANIALELPRFSDAVTPDNIQANGQVMLANSRIGGERIDTADIDGSYVDRIGRINHFAIAGPDIAATASGLISLNDQTESNLQYDITATDLRLVAALTRQPISGAGHVAGTVTGQSAMLTSMGMLSANRLKYADNVDVLTLNSRFTVTVPDLDVSRTSGNAESTAAFARIDGLEATELTAETTYNAPELQFRTSFSTETRDLSAAGLALLHPDHQEVHLESLSLGVGQTVWTLPAGQEARIQYGDRAIRLAGLELQRGDQHLTADGILYLGGEGMPIRASDLNIRATALQIRDVNDLLLGKRQITGTLTGVAHVTGTTSAPEISGTFDVTSGQVQGVNFEALSGKVDYRDREVALDVQLRQSAAASLTAMGRVPLSLLRPGLGPTDDPLDLRVESTSIDAGLFQALTPEVENLKGQLQVSLHATGTARTPHVTGNFELTGASFRVAATGASYNRLDTSLHFADDQVIVDQFKLLDDENDALFAEGALGIQQRRIGSVDVHASTSQFKVLDNEFGRIQIDAVLRITGQAQRPVIQGNIETRTGRLQVDRLLEQLTKSPYAVGPDQATSPTTLRSIYDALDLDLRLGIDDNMLLRGTDIRTRYSNIGLGDVNVTVGGNINLHKVPNETIRVVGDLEIVRGFYSFQGRRFDVARESVIRFEGLDVLDPALRITAQRDISGVITKVQLQGTVMMPELTLSSQPPLDEADILSLIVFNAPVNELGQNERISLAQRAGELAAGYFTTPLANSIADALGLDVVEIRAAGETGLGPSISIGQQVGNRLFLGFRQEFGVEDVTELSFEYRLTELLRLVTTIAQGSRRTHRMQRIESSAADLILTISY